MKLEDGIIFITVHSFLTRNLCQMTFILGVQDWSWQRSHMPQFTLEVVGMSSKSLHASWEFLFPVLWWDPRPLKVQLLFNVLLLTLLKEHGVIVAEEWQKAQYWFCRINESLRWWLYGNSWERSWEWACGTLRVGWAQVKVCWNNTREKLQLKHKILTELLDTPSEQHSPPDT